MPGASCRLAVDTSRWPLVLLTHEGQATDEALRAHLDEVEREVLGRRRFFVQVVDQLRGERPNPIQRTIIARHHGRMAELYQRYCRGQAYAAGPELRSAMVAVFWREPPRYPYTFVATMEEALAWARERLADAGRPGSQAE